MRRNWFIAAIVVGVVAIVVAALAMRLSDDSSSQPTTEEWANSVCTDLSDWRDSITSLADVSGQTLTPSLLREKLDAADSATTTLVSELRDLGRPDLASGDQLEQELQSSVDDLQSSYDELKTAADQAANASGTPFLQQLAGLATKFSSFLTAIQSTVDTLRNSDVGFESKAELQQAFDDAPACQSLRKQS